MIPIDAQLAAMPAAQRPPLSHAALLAENRTLRDELARCYARLDALPAPHAGSQTRLLRELDAARQTVAALANVIEARDRYTRGHSDRVGWLARLTGQALELPPAHVEALEWAGMLHDVGKVGIPEQILNKPGRLTPEEYEQVRQHPRMSYEMLRPVVSLGPVLPAVLHHHENHDGSGYPDGLRGEQIPLDARILRIADLFDAITSNRSYRSGMTFEGAIAELRGGAGRITDPRVTAAFIDAILSYRRTDPDDFERRFGHIQREEDGPMPAAPLIHLSGGSA